MKERSHGEVRRWLCRPGLGDDARKGKVTPFPQSVKLKPGEVAVFSWKRMIYGGFTLDVDL